jgi:glycosyltransferase involved in cell wall biosynthesis
VSAIPLRAGCPLLSTIHEVPWAGSEGATGDHATAHKLRLHLAANFSARLLCVSERTAQQVRALHPDATARIRVTPHGLAGSWWATDDAASAARMPDGVIAPWVLAVGRLRHKKNLMRLLEAFALRVAAGGQERLVLAGPDDEASAALRERAGQPDLAGRVVFAGYVDEPVLRALYRGASCVVYPSLFEGFGLPVLEGMAAGVPVIVSRQGAVAEATGETSGAGADSAVLAVDGEDAQALAHGMARVLDEPGLAATLVAAGGEHVRGCSAARAARAVLDVYEELR